MHALSGENNCVSGFQGSVIAVPLLWEFHYLLFPFSKSESSSVFKFFDNFIRVDNTL